MPTIDEMLSQYASFGAPEQGTSNTVGLSVDQKTALKQAEVAAVSQRKREVLSGKSISEQEAYRLGISKSTGYGADSAPALSKALLNEPIDKLVSVDGPETALRLLRQQISGNAGYGIDKNMPTNTTNNITDTALNIASGAVNAIGGAGAWVGSEINDKLGTTLSGSLDAFNNFIEPLASDRSQSSRTISRITNELDTRDNLAQYDKDKANGDALATLKREGKNALGAVSIAASDPTMLLEGTAKGVGSMAAFGYVNKAVQGIGGAGKVATMIRDASMSISGGLVGGGSAYQQNVSDVMAKSPEEMAKISPQFNEYVSQGMSPKDAQIRVASESGEYAASIAAPLGAMTTMMAPGLEKLPVKVSSIKGAIKDTAFEPVQEAAESFNEQFASNAGKAAKFNPKQDMAEGMGKAVGEGALYGLTSAGATQAPGAAGLIAKAATNKVATGVSSAVGSVMEKAESLKKENEKDSTVSDTAIAQRATTVADQTPVIAATMQAAVKDDPAMQEKVANLTAIMQSVSSHDPSDFEGTSDSIKASLAGSKTKIDELNALKSVFHSKDSTDADKDFAGAKLIDELGAVGAFLDTQTDVIVAVQDEPTKQFIRDLKQLSADTLSNKEFIATKNEVATRLAEKHKVSQPELVIASDPTTEEAKQAIMETLAVASTLPTEARKEAVEAVLKHSASGALKLTPEQKSNLEVSKAAIAALQDNLVEGSELMRVSVEAGNASQAGDKGKSAIQHATDIVKTMSEGNTSLAKTLLEGFGRFAQHYQNKAEAVNQATQEVPAEQKNNKYKGLYQQLANGQWLKEPAIFTFQKSGRGVELAVQVHKEARAIGGMYNAIAAMYPEMGLESVKLTEPDPIFLPDGKFDPKATQQGIAGNELAGIAAYRKRLSTKKLKGAKNGQGQKEEVLIAPVAPATPMTPPVKAEPAESIEKVFATDKVEAATQAYAAKLKEEAELRKAKSKPLPEEVGSLYGALRRTLSIESFKSDLKGDKRFNFLVARKGEKGSSIEDLIATGTLLDDFLPDSMVVDKSANLREAVGHIVEKLNSGNYITQKLQDRLDQIGLTIQQIDEVISNEELEEYIQALQNRDSEKAATARAKRAARAVKANEGDTYQLVEEKPVSTVASEPTELVLPTSPPAPPVPPTAPVPPAGSTKAILEKVSPYHTKDQAKSDKATKFIGLGAPGSSTESYRTSWGKLANSGSYTSEDVVFISSNGNRPGRRSPNFKELAKAIAAGATILTDGKKDRERSYNIGEREVAEYLLLNKYEELIDGTWTLKAVVTPAANPISDEELNRLDVFLAEKYKQTQIVTNPSAYTPEKVAEAKKILTQLTVDFAQETTDLFDDFPDENVELDFLSNVAPSLIANTPGKLERLWELRNKLGKLFADLGVSKLLSTAGNILIAGTKSVSEKRASQFIDRPLDTFIQMVNGKPTLKEGDKILRNDLAKYIVDRTRILHLAVERIVLSEINSDNNLIKLLQLNHLDSLGNSNKYRIDLLPQNRLFSLLAPVGNDSTPEVRLDPYLMEAAGLAFMQWMLSAADRKAIVDEKTVANILGIDENVVTEAQIAEYSERITNIEAIDAISAGIMRHWSLKPKDNIQTGYSEGVARVLAKEMLDVAVSKELIAANFGLNHRQMRVDRNKTVDDYGVDKLPKNIKLANAIFPDLIDNTAFIENEQVMYIGDVAVPTTKTILREPDQLLTPEQIRAQDNNQKTIHRIDESSYKLFMGIGAKGVFDILSLPENTDLLNVGHAKSVIGKRQGISAVFTKMEEVFQRVSNQAIDGDVHGVPIHYKFEYTSTNRLQMIGSHTPQASKWMRNVVLPTHGAIDATYGSTGYKLLMLSIAQNLGVSIQNYSVETNIENIASKLDGEYAAVIDLLRNRITNNEDAVSTELIGVLKTAFGSKFTPSALYALHEYARYLATSKNGKKNFYTGLYIEADGVNNGPAAALMMLGGTSELTYKFFINAARVGYFIGSSDRTLNQQRQEDSTGLYEAGAQALPSFLTDFRDKAAGFVIPAGEFTPAIKLDEYFDHVSLMVSSLLPNFSMDEKGNYTIGRSVIKNPLTKTIYGSGSRGMGNGLLKEMVEAFYEKLSIVKLYKDSGMSLDESFAAVFGERYQDLFDSMDQLARHNVEIVGGQFVVKNGLSTNAHLFQNEDYLKFEVSGAVFTSMSNNINTFFSKQVKDAITDVMSPAVMDSSQLLVKATSFRTEFMAYEFNKLYEAALAKRKSSDHLYRQADGLSNDELRAITAKLTKIFPYIKTTTQSFNPVGRSKISSDNFIGLTSTKYKVTPSVFVPESAGVSGVPYMIIGMGDGRTIQIFSDGGPEDTLNIYDGIHMGLGKAEEYSKRANSAVWDSWQQGNPFGALFPSLSAFVGNYDWTSFLAAAKSEPEKIAPILAALRVKSVTKLSEHIANLLNNVSNSAKNIDATHQVLGEYKATIDQLASIGSPYVKPGVDIIIDDASIAEINSKISSIAQTSTNYATDGVIASVAAKFNVPAPTKPVRYLLRSFITKGGAANKTATIQSLMSTGLLDNVSVEYGPISVFRSKLTIDDFGGYDPKTNTIYIASDKSGGVETLTHEMIHAATFRAIANHYANPENSTISTEVGRLEALMDGFLNRAALSKDDTIRDVFSKISAINDRSIKLNEFMAYGLSNATVRADLTSATALKLPEDTASRYTGKIKQLIERILAKFGFVGQRNQYDQLVFNTVYVMAGGSAATTTNTQILKMSIGGLGTNDRLSAVTDFFASSLAKHLKNQIDPAFANLPPKIIHTKNPGEFTRAQRLGAQVSNLIASKFNSNHQEQVALNMIVQTLATGVELDGNILSGIEELYAHFAKGLKAEDFLLVDSAAATQADLYEANEMYNLVMGNFNTAKDVYGRGQTLPIFFALGLVNDRFRAVLAKKGLPDALKIASTDTDAFLTSSANVLMSKLDKALTGTAKARNTQEALDSVFSVLVQNGTDASTLVGTGLNKAGSVIDGMNDRVVSALEYVSAKLDSGANSVLASSSNKTVQAAANVAKNIALAMNENTAARVGEFAVSLANQSNLFKPLKSLIADFVGRTDSNKLLYDMIKFVRSTVQQDRQHYREELPSVLAAQFTRKLSDKEWTHLFYGLAKTDLAQLVDVIGIKDTVALLNDPTKINTRIASLESNLRTQVPKSWPRLQKKAEQLANFMLTGKYGPMLLRNADAIQLNYGGNRDDIDSLVTLYALKNLEQPIKDTLSSLVQTEKAGIDTLVGYLSGQRKDDIHPDEVVRLNAYKGYIPSLQNESVSLRVESDTEHAAMLEKGYIRVGKYTGSVLENRGSYSYYFLNAPARAPFSQGLVQNVNSTSGGIDTMTMFTSGPVAGRITDPRAVNKLSPYLNNDNLFDENLLPIFDETGAIVAIERGIDPTKLAMLKQDTHLAKMIGVWRGRQVEEYKSREINKAMVSRFKEMYDTDISKNPATSREYINLFDSKDPIHKDAIKLMPIYMRRALEAEFGKDTFMVREELVDSAIGYRTPSVGDAWTGVSGWSPESLELAKRVTMSVFGNKAYEYLVNAEQLLKNAIQDVKLIIVVKSVIVPVGNMLSNIIQLMSRGVPIKDIVRGVPKKVSELNFYTKQRLRKIELEVALRTAEGNGDVVATRKAKNELETIEDSFRRLSIWPLINAGEFSAISDVGISRDDIVLSEGRLHAYMESLVDKLPDGVRTAAKYGLVAKDTALFQGLQKAVEYGDFLAKAIEYDYLTGSKKLSKEDSLARISEEFVNYDLLMGRFREYAENIGLLWFTAFKIRSAKIAASIIRNNPFHALMSAIPHSFMPAGTGSPITDNGVVKVMSGDIWHSIGFGQALRAPTLNPWVNLAH